MTCSIMEDATTGTKQPTIMIFVLMLAAHFVFICVPPFALFIYVYLSMCLLGSTLHNMRALLLVVVVVVVVVVLVATGTICAHQPVSQ